MRLFLHIAVCIGCVAAPRTFLTGAGGDVVARPLVYEGQAPSQPGLEEEFGRLLRDRYEGTRPDYKAFNERTIGETHVSVDERGSTRRVTRAMAVAHLSKFPGVWGRCPRR